MSLNFLIRLPQDAQGKPCSASELFVNQKVRSLQNDYHLVVWTPKHIKQLGTKYPF